jgi:hypothetical protein
MCISVPCRRHVAVFRCLCGVLSHVHSFLQSLCFLRCLDGVMFDSYHRCLRGAMFLRCLVGVRSQRVYPGALAAPCRHQSAACLSGAFAASGLLILVVWVPLWFRWVSVSVPEPCPSCSRCHVLLVPRRRDLVVCLLQTLYSVVFVNCGFSAFVAPSCIGTVSGHGVLCPVSLWRSPRAYV